MTVYNINLGIGWASSGVEYAQAYRAKLLRNIQQPAKFVFMDMILADNIQHLMMRSFGSTLILRILKLRQPLIRWIKSWQALTVIRLERKKTEK